MGCCVGCAKFVVSVINALLLLIGLVPLVFGIIALVSKDILQTVIKNIPGTGHITDIVDLNELIKSSAIVLIVFGAVLVIIGFIGFFGACCSSSCLLWLYLILVLIIILAEIAIIVLAVAFPSTFSSGVKTLMLETFKTERLIDCNVTNTTTSPYVVNITCDTGHTVSLAWNGLQYELNCCGVNDYTDYANNGTVNNWVQRNPFALAPLTCCSHPANSKFDDLSNDGLNPTCAIVGNDPSLYSPKGCFDVLLNSIVTSPVVIGVLAGIGALEIILFISTIALLRNASSDKD